MCAVLKRDPSRLTDKTVSILRQLAREIATIQPHLRTNLQMSWDFLSLRYKVAREMFRC